MNATPVMYDLGKDAVHASGLVARPDAPAPKDRTRVVTSAEGSDARGSGNRQAPQDMVSRSLEVLARKLAPFQEKSRQDAASAPKAAPAPKAPQAPSASQQAAAPQSNNSKPPAAPKLETAGDDTTRLKSAASTVVPLRRATSPSQEAPARVDASRSVPVRQNSAGPGAVEEITRIDRDQASSARRAERVPERTDSGQDMADLMERAAEQKSAMPGPAVVVGLPIELMRYDMNGDGRIDSMEMEHVKRAKDEDSGFRSVTAATVGQHRRFSEAEDQAEPMFPPAETTVLPETTTAPVEEPGRWVEDEETSRWADAIAEPGGWVEEEETGQWADAIHEPGRWVEEETKAEDAIPPKIYGEEGGWVDEMEKQVSHYRRLVEEEAHGSLNLRA